MTRKKYWSLVELTIILVVLSILCAILAPVIDRYVRNAKVCRAREDVQALGMAICMFIEDTANSYFLIDGGGPTGEASRKIHSGGAPNQNWINRVDMLVSDGDIPELESTTANSAPGDADSWVKKVNFETVDFLEYHLVTNHPGYRVPSQLDNPWSDPMFARSESGGFNSEFAWRGPYITAPVDPDPWGNRYASNVKFLDAKADSSNATAAINGFESDCIVLSAGPDEEVDTRWSVDGLTPGDDDMLYSVSANSRP